MVVDKKELYDKVEIGNIIREKFNNGGCGNTIKILTKRDNELEGVILDNPTKVVYVRKFDADSYSVFTRG